MVAVAFVLVGDLKLAASLTDFAVYVVFLSVNATVVVLRFRMPDAPRPFRIPLTIARIPLIAVLGFAATVLLMSRLEADALLLGAVMAAVGLSLGWLIARRTGWAS